MENKYENCCIIARESSTGDALGWACLATTSKRTVFQGVAELSVYIATVHQGKKIATRLLDHLFPLSEASNIWTIQSGIFPENTISLKMHEKYGFREVGRREKIGKMLIGPYKDQWRDIVLLERRSTVAGMN
jgi:phosphinothricin acetyltransferase